MEVNQTTEMSTNPNGGDKKSTGSISFVIKTLIIGLLCLLLLIPLAFLNGLVDSRKREGEKVTSEITSRWGKSQNLMTPLLAIPYKPNPAKAEETYLYLIPNEVTATATLEIENRHRSIYQVPVYTAHTEVKGTWLKQDIQQALSEVKGSYDLSRAEICYSISDPTGYKDRCQLQVNGQALKVKTEMALTLVSYIDDDVYNTPPCVVAYNEYVGEGGEGGAQSASYPLPSPTEEELSDLSFQLNLEIAGSKYFGILANANNATTLIKGNWPDPSFQGKRLPTDYQISKNDFEATWNTFYEESCIIGDEALPSLYKNSHFISFLNPADHYVQTSRSVSYGILIIVLTLLSVFLMELWLRQKGRSINILHYLLTGISLVLFYTLLLSFSELIGFRWAYLIASIMTIGLNTIYFRLILKDRKMAALLCGIMTLLYLTVFVLLQIKVYALLIGSLVLFIILAIVMYTSVKVMHD